jgi:histidine triad (HIT) family protein
MSNCIFCKIVKGEAPSWKVLENEDVYAFLDINPVSRYHTLVIPKKHYENIFDIPERDLQAVIAMVRKLALIYKRDLEIENLQIVNSNGAEGQQDVFHIHYHIVPRSKGDGQNIKWHTYPEWRADFDKMLDNISLKS